MALKIKNRKELIKIIGLLLIALSSFFLIYKYFHTERLDQDSENKIEEFFVEEETNTNDNTSIPVEDNKSNNLALNYNYMAILEIPSINLKRGLVDPSSKYNNIKYNVKIIYGSSMPNVENGNFILASHNGASYISFFKNLDKLNFNDKIYIYYDGYKYEYSLNNVYEVNKNGKVEINRDYNKTTITLITCKKYSSDTQNVYIGYLSNKTLY